MNEYFTVGLTIVLTVAAIMAASVKGCAIVNNPDTIRADAEARIKLNQEFTKK